MISQGGEVGRGAGRWSRGRGSSGADGLKDYDLPADALGLNMFVKGLCRGHYLEYGVQSGLAKDGVHHRHMGFLANVSNDFREAFHPSAAVGSFER
jgi:hypothetical protein